MLCDDIRIELPPAALGALHQLNVVGLLLIRRHLLSRLHLLYIAALRLLCHLAFEQGEEILVGLYRRLVYLVDEVAPGGLSFNGSLFHHRRLGGNGRRFLGSKVFARYWRRLLHLLARRLLLDYFLGRLFHLLILLLLVLGPVYCLFGRQLLGVVLPLDRGVLLATHAVPAHLFFQQLQPPLGLLDLARRHILLHLVIYLLRGTRPRGELPALRLDVFGLTVIGVLEVLCGLGRDLRFVEPVWRRGLLAYRCFL